MNSVLAAISLHAYVVEWRNFNSCISLIVIPLIPELEESVNVTSKDTDQVSVLDWFVRLEL